MHELPEESLDLGGQQCACGEQVKSSLLYNEILNPSPGPLLCIISLMAKAMRKQLMKLKSLHDIVHNVSSSDSFNRSRIFCLAGTVHLKGRFQNDRTHHNFLMFNCLPCYKFLSILSCEFFLV